LPIKIAPDYTLLAGFFRQAKPELATMDTFPNVRYLYFFEMKLRH